jgi:hypothetical protein
MPTQKPKFRRLLDSIEHRELITPHLELFLHNRGRESWPEEFAIKVYNKETKFDGYFHPSRHAAMASLFLFYEFHPEFRPHLSRIQESTEGVMAMMWGSAGHAILQSIMIEAGMAEPEDIEVSFKNEFRHCTGRLDVRKVTLPHGVTIPCEIKTTAYLPRGPIPSHVVQMQPYMDLACGEPQERMSLLYALKNHPHAFREFVIRRDEELLKAIYGKWQRVRDAIERDSIKGIDFCPGCKPVPGNKTYVECPARAFCKINEEVA